MPESRAGLMTIRGAQATARIGLGTLVVACAPLFVHRIEPIAGYPALRRGRGPVRYSQPGWVPAVPLLGPQAGVSLLPWPDIGDRRCAMAAVSALASRAAP